MVGRLKKTLYGTRDASSEWHLYSMKTFQDCGLTLGVSNPTLLEAAAEEDLTIGYEHGDDIFLTGEEEFLLEYEKKLGQYMMLKRKAFLGPDPEDGKDAVVLNRHIHWAGNGINSKIEYEPDPRHVDILLHEFGFLSQNVKGVTTPITAQEAN